MSASNLLEMCDHRMDLVVKVERMRRAILVSCLMLMPLLFDVVDDN